MLSYGLTEHEEGVQILDLYPAVGKHRYKSVKGTSEI